MVSNDFFKKSPDKSLVSEVIKMCGIDHLALPLKQTRKAYTIARIQSLVGVPAPVSEMETIQGSWHHPALDAWQHFMPVGFPNTLTIEKNPPLETFPVVFFNPGSMLTIPVKPLRTGTDQ